MHEATHRYANTLDYDPQGYTMRARCQMAKCLHAHLAARRSAERPTPSPPPFSR
jgi:hypothetical protein